MSSYVPTPGSPLVSTTPAVYNQMQSAPQLSPLAALADRDEREFDMFTSLRQQRIVPQTQPKRVLQPPRPCTLLSSSLATSATIDDFIKKERKSPIQLIHDPVVFAKVMRLESKDFMEFWKFAQADRTVKNLLFYKEATFVEDSLAFITTTTPDISYQFTRARNAGLTQSIIRFLLKATTFDGTVVSRGDPILLVPEIPEGLIPTELKYNYEKIVNSFVLSEDNQLAIPPSIRQCLINQVSEDTDFTKLKTNILDECMDAVLQHLYQDVFKRYVNAVADYNAQQSDLASQSVQAHSLNSSIRKDGILDSVFADEEAATSSNSRREEPAMTTSSSAPNSFNSRRGATTPGPPRLSIGERGTSFDRPTMMYSKPAQDDRKFNLLMDVTGFMDRKDTEPIMLEFSRMCFVKVMDPNSVAFRDFTKFAKSQGYKSHINFISTLNQFEDTLAALTPAISPTVPSAYSRARNDYQITQTLSRFINRTGATDPSYNRVTKLPSLPPIPTHPVPESLKTTVIDIYGTFIGRDSEQEIHFTTNTLRSTVQSALQQDFLRPIESDLLDGCADDVINELYEKVFRAFVIENGGKLVVSESTPPSSIRGASGEFVRPGTGNGRTSSGGSPMLKKLSLSQKGSSGAGGFLTGLFGKGKRSASLKSVERITPAVMLFEPNSEMTAIDSPSDISHSYSSFLNVMCIESPSFREFQKFAERSSKEFFGNLLLYQAVSALEDRLAMITPAESSDDALTYRTARSQGLTQSMSRFIQNAIEQKDRNALDVASRVLLPSIPIKAVQHSQKPQFINIFTTYISEKAPVPVSLTPSLRQTVQAAIENDLRVPFATNLFDACLDHVILVLYETIFVGFVETKNSPRDGLVLKPFIDKPEDKIPPSVLKPSYYGLNSSARNPPPAFGPSAKPSGKPRSSQLAAKPLLV